MEYEDLKEIIKVVDNFDKSESESPDNEESNEETGWNLIPENVLVRIFKQLSVKEILNASAVCKRWNFISSDSLLWKHKFTNDFKVGKIPRRPGSESWYDEYKRLCDNVPLVLTEVLTKHTNQVLHVSYSNNGKMFATCSKDGQIVVWRSSFPSSVKYEYDMKLLSWKYTQYSQFNQSDTLLLVSGVHFGTPHSTSGEIAVFSVVNGFQLRCRVQNKPYDIFGCWFSDQYLLSGDLRWLAHLVSKSTIVFNKANQEIASEHTPVMKDLFNFYNRNASSIRNLMIAQCPWLEEEMQTEATAGSSSQNQPSTSSQVDNVHQSGNPVSKIVVNPASEVSGPSQPRRSPESDDYGYERPFKYSDEFRREFEEPASESSSSEVDDMAVEDDRYEDLDDACPKYLIFSTGSRTYTPHQIGIKRVGRVNFPKKLDPGPSIQERLARRDRRRQLEELIASLSPEEARLQLYQFNNGAEAPFDPDWEKFDGIDALIDLEGHIIGLGLSPDNRFLYVNSRPWPVDCVISNPLDPPPISQEIDIHVIDLLTMKKVGTMLRAHKAYTPNTECFFIFLNVSDNFVGSGSEDRNAYSWERYYGICLASYPHNDVVNSVAFNPKDDQMLITTSDDYEIKIWRSQWAVRELGIAGISRANEVKNKTKKN